MRKLVKVGSVLLMVLLLSSLAVAQKPAAQPTGTTNQLILDAQDVITASDAGGGYLSSRDILIIILVILALIGLGVIAV